MVPVAEYDDATQALRPVIRTVIPGRLLRVRFQVLADLSEFELLAAYMPAPASDALRVAEIRRCWQTLREELQRLGEATVLCGDLNAEPEAAGARRAKPALHRALADGLLQQLMRDFDLSWLGKQMPTYFQALTRAARGASSAAR